METKQFNGRLEIKLATDSGGDTATKSFTGYGAYFGNIDSDGDEIVRGAFKASLARHEAAGTMPLMLLNHDAWGKLPIGVWKSIQEDAKGLVVEGVLLETSAGQDVYTALKAGAISGLSIGFRCTGYEIAGNTRLITEADLMEVSVVTFPANDLARVADVKSANTEIDDAALMTMLAKARFGQGAVEALFKSREVAEEAEPEAIEAEDAEANDEAKYDEAGLIAVIRKSVETTKEMYVR